MQVKQSFARTHMSPASTQTSTKLAKPNLTCRALAVARPRGCTRHTPSSLGPQRPGRGSSPLPSLVPGWHGAVQQEISSSRSPCLCRESGRRRCNELDKVSLPDCNRTAGLFGLSVRESTREGATCAGGRWSSTSGFGERGRIAACGPRSSGERTPGFLQCRTAAAWPRSPCRSSPSRSSPPRSWAASATPSRPPAVSAAASTSCGTFRMGPGTRWRRRGRCRRRVRSTQPGRYVRDSDRRTPPVLQRAMHVPRRLSAQIRVVFD